jgi:hypothetical protein
MFRLASATILSKNTLQARLVRQPAVLARRERIGWALRERYRIPKELPPILLTLVGKLDAFEGYLLLRKRQRTHSGMMRELLGL